MLPATYDLAIYQGDYFILTIIVQDANGAAIDLDGYTVKAQIRKRKSDVTPLDEFTVTILDPPADGKVTLELTTDQTTDLLNGYWDVQFEIDGKPATYLAGKITITKEVTRP